MASPASNIHIFLADDHLFAREGLKALLNKQPDMKVVGEAPCGEMAWKQAKVLQPEVVVMGISMPGMDGIEATRRLKQDRPEVKVLTLADRGDLKHVRQLWHVGTSGYLLKQVTSEELIHAIHVIMAGKFYLDATLASSIVESNLRKELGEETRPSEGLSEREGEVLKSIALGYSNKEISARLGVSVKTVETYKSRLMDKLNLRSRPEIVRYALQQGWLREE